MLSVQEEMRLARDGRHSGRRISGQMIAGTAACVSIRPVSMGCVWSHGDVSTTRLPPMHNGVFASRRYVCQAGQAQVEKVNCHVWRVVLITT